MSVVRPREASVAAFRGWYERMLRRPVVGGVVIAVPTFSLLLYDILRCGRYRHLTFMEIGGLAWEFGDLPGRWDELAGAALQRQMVVGR